MVTVTSVRSIALDLPTAIAGGEIVSPMDAFPHFRHRRREWYGLMSPVLVLVASSDGQEGVGMTAGGPATATIVNEHLGRLVVGHDPADIAGLWEMCRRAAFPYGAGGLAAMARSAIDLALWDLAGRRAGVPVAALLTPHPKSAVPAYISTVQPAEAARADWVGIKLPLEYGPWDGQAGFRANRDRIAQARRVLGHGIAVMADAWMGWDIDYTTKFASVLADEGVLWLEEPLPPDATESLAEVRQALGTTKLATGEHGDSVDAFARLAATGGVDVLQPDVEWCGGLTAALRIAEIARNAGLELSPHLGGRVWGLHFIAASDVCRWAEWYVPVDQPPDVLSGSPTAAGGLLRLSDEPGFGVTVNWAVVERFGRW